MSCYTLFYGSSLTYITYVQRETNAMHKKKSFVDQIQTFSAFSSNSAMQIAVPFQNTTDTFCSNNVIWLIRWMTDQLTKQQTEQPANQSTDQPTNYTSS